MMLVLGPMPGRSLYSQVEAPEGAPLVALRDTVIDGRAVRAYTHWGAEALPTQCAQAGNPWCRRVVFNQPLQRWQRPETFGEGLSRYTMIARAIQETTGGGELADYMTVIVRHESGFRRDVHEGSNHKPFRRTTKLEDSGRSWCLGQVMIARSPSTIVPIHEHKDWTARELVGVTPAATTRCLTVVATRLRKIARRCSRGGSRPIAPACMFLGYAGTDIKPTHPFIRARLASFAKLSGSSRELGPEIRSLIGLDGPAT